ncbi:MAG TPA: hypothetical protein VIP48_04365 [Streptosporangiaceae bacterium]
MTYRARQDVGRAIIAIEPNARAIFRWSASRPGGPVRPAVRRPAVHRPVVHRPAVPGGESRFWGGLVSVAGKPG